jgi:hypothetical protein
MGGTYSFVAGRPKEKRPLGRPKSRCEENVKIDLQEVGWGCTVWIATAQVRDRWLAVVNTVMNLSVQ